MYDNKIARVEFATGEDYSLQNDNSKEQIFDSSLEDVNPGDV